MLQIVRRPTQQPSALTNKSFPFISRKERRLEVAFFTLASTNLFVLSSAVAFYMLMNQS